MPRTDIRPQDVERAARNLLTTESGPGTSTEVAIRATQACEQLVRHLSRLPGGMGSRILLKRSLHLASASFPWLRYAELGDRICKILAVAKMRGFDHQKELRIYDIGPDGIVIGEPLTDHEVILKGNPRRLSHTEAGETPQALI